MWSFIQTAPALISLANLIPLVALVVQTEADNPKALSFAISITLFSSEYFMIQATGSKISSLAIVISWVTLVKAVGLTK